MYAAMLDISRQLYTEVIDDISGNSMLCFIFFNRSFACVALTKQLTDKHNLPVKSAFGASRGFYLQLYCGGNIPMPESETPAPTGAQAAGRVIDSAQDLPSEFLKVTKSRNTFSFTTLDLIKLNSKK